MSTQPERGHFRVQCICSAGHQQVSPLPSQPAFYCVPHINKCTRDTLFDVARTHAFNNCFTCASASAHLPCVRTARTIASGCGACVCVTLNWSFRSAVRCGALRMGVACMHVHKYICLCVWRLWVALGTRPSRCGGAVPAAMQVSARADERAYGNYVSSSPLNRGQAPTYQRALSLQCGLNEIV